MQIFPLFLVKNAVMNDINANWRYNKVLFIIIIKWQKNEKKYVRQMNKSDTGVVISHFFSCNYRIIRSVCISDLQ